METLSAVIITKNEEADIGRCLDSLNGIATEIIVIDSHSTDRTKDICLGHGCIFETRDWEGYSKTKNYGNSLVTSSYILSIDADEALSDELKSSIKKFLEKPTADFVSMNRLSNLCGKWIHHTGWYPDTKPRIWKNGFVEWQGDIHEIPVAIKEASKGHLKGDLLHYTYPTLSSYYSKIDGYTTLMAQKDFEKGKRCTLLGLWIKPWFKFWQRFILKKGFLDGYYGFIVAKTTAFYAFSKYSKLRELQKGN